VNRRHSALLLSAVGAGLLIAAPGGERSKAVEADVAAVDSYLAHLSATVPRPPATKLAKEPPEDPDLAKRAARLDRAEPIVGAVFSAVR